MTSTIQHISISIVLVILWNGTNIAQQNPLYRIRTNDSTPTEVSRFSIDNAPYCAIEGLHQITDTGVSLQELGFDSITTFLRGIDEATVSECIAFSPDGKFLASASANNTIKIWDITSKNLFHTFKGHSDRVNSVQWSPDGKFIASGSGDKMLILWDVSSKKIYHTFQGHTEYISSVSFSPDNAFIASGSGDKTIKIWNISTKGLHHTFQGHTDAVNSIHWSPIGTFIASGSGDNTSKLWDINLQSLIHTFTDHTNKITSVCFSPDGKLLATGSADKTIKIWDCTKKNLLNSFANHTDKVTSICFNSNGRYLASGSLDNTINLWDISLKCLIYTFSGHTHSINTVCFSPDSRFVASGSTDKTIKLWDLFSKSLLYTFQGHSTGAHAVCFSPEGQLLATGSNDMTVNVWDMTTHRLAYSFLGHSGYVSSVQFSPNGMFLVSGSGDKTIKLWDITSQNLKYTLIGHKNQISSVCFSPDGKYIASASWDKSVKLWNVDSKKLIHTFQGHTDYVSSVCFSPDGKYLASGSWDKSVKLWNVDSEKLIHTFKGHTDYVSSVCFSPDGKYIASGSWDKSVKLWSVDSKKLTQTFSDHTYWVNAVCFNPDGTILVSGSADKTIKLWNLSAKKLSFTLSDHTSWVNAVTFSPDGTTIASESESGLLHFWNRESKSLTYMFLAGSRGCWLRIDSKNRLYRGDDGTLLQLKTETAQETKTLSKITHDTFSIRIQPHHLILEPGLQKDISITVINQCSHPINWLHLQSPVTADSIVRIDPPINILRDTGRVQWKHSQIGYIGSLDTAMFHARVTLNCTMPSPFIKPDTQTAFVTVVSAHGTSQSKPIILQIHSPYVEVSESVLNQDNKTIRLTLANNGNRIAQNIDCRLRLAKSNPPNMPEKITISLIEPDSFRSVAFVLPSRIDSKKQQVLLDLSTNTNQPFYQTIPLTIKSQRSFPWFFWMILVLFPTLIIVLGYYYFVVYHHPLILKLIDKPLLLLEQPPELIAEIKQRLQQTRRLSKVLAEAEVSRSTLTEAISFFKEKNNDKKAHHLAKRLGMSLQFIQEGLWALNLSKKIPLNIDQCLLYFPESKVNPGTVFDELTTLSITSDRLTIIIGQTSEFQAHLRLNTKDTSNKFIAPSGKELTRLLLCTKPQYELSQIIADQVNLIQISPYQLEGGINRESVFYGRREVLAHIIERAPSNYLIVGGRQLGKSSILKALQREYAKENPDIRCIYLSLHSEELLPRLSAELQLPETTDIKALSDFFRTQKTRFVIMIDEADIFIRAQRNTNYTIVNTLHNLSQENSVTFIIAGFWDLYEQAILDYQSPLRNFGEPIFINALEEEACKKLATQPLQYLGIEFTNPSVVDTLITATGYRANLVACICTQLLFALKPDQRTISLTDVTNALYSAPVEAQLKGWDALTDDEDNCRIDRIIVYSTIEKETFDHVYLIDQCKNNGLSIDSHKLDLSLDRLVLAFILGKKEKNSFYYRVPLFKEMILRMDPKTRLSLEKEGFLKKT